MSDNQYEADLVIIGGGIGGISAAKEAIKYGISVAIFDHVSPTAQGTSWGLGGTNANVGCIPKKIIHFSALLGNSIKDSVNVGWDVKESQNNWNALCKKIGNHTKMLSFRYRAALKSSGIKYFNSLADIIDNHSVSYTLKTKGVTETKVMTAKYIIIATGCRPYIPPDIPGALELGITSDDIFSRKNSPGKTLCVGGSFVSIECAGFLTELNYDVTIAARSILLRSCDRDCVDKVTKQLEAIGTRILLETTVISLNKLDSGKIEVTLRDETGGEKIETFDTVLFGLGRRPNLTALNLSNVGIEVNGEGKILVTDNCTAVDSIFAIGDICAGRPQSTPVAMKSAEMLIKRLFGKLDTKIDYTMIPRILFTPFEYGFIGMTEEEAILQYGNDDVEVYLSEWNSLELTLAHRYKHIKHGENVEIGSSIFAKLICLKSCNEKVIGLHYIGPNASEIIQGFALAIKLGATKSDFDAFVGLHPTDAEIFTRLHITKRSGHSWNAEGTCEGGVCSF